MVNMDHPGQDIEFKVLPVTCFWAKRSEVLNDMLRGKTGIVLERYNKPIALVMPVPDSFLEVMGEFQPYEDQEDEAGGNGDGINV